MPIESLAAIIPFIIGLAWLLKESDYLRINLMSLKAVTKEIEYERKSWDDLEPDAQRIPDKQKPFWLKYPEHMHPLCGLDWIQNTMHVIPVYQVEINTYGVKYTMHIKEAGILTKVMKANKVTKAQKLAYV